MYFVMVLVLGGITWYFFHRNDNPSFDVSEVNFTVKDTNDIQTIFLSNMNSDNVKIDRTPDGWKLNDSFDVREDAVSGLLDVLSKQYAEKPVPAGYHDDAIKEMSAIASKIEIYNKKKEKTHCFYVSQRSGPNNCTYMLNDGGKRPYIVKIPLENNFVGIRYFTGVAEWRSKHLMFGSNPVSMAAVSYPDSAFHSFTMQVLSTDSFQVQLAQTPASTLNTKRVRSYLGFLDKIYCTGFEPEYRFKDSVIMKGKQMATLTVQRQGKAPQTLTFYFKQASRDTKGVLTIGGIEFDSDYFFGLLNNRDFLIMNRKTTQMLLRRGGEFFEADPK